MNRTELDDRHLFLFITNSPFPTSIHCLIQKWWPIASQFCWRKSESALLAFKYKKCFNYNTESAEHQFYLRTEDIKQSIIQLLLHGFIKNLSQITITNVYSSVSTRKLKRYTFSLIVIKAPVHIYPRGGGGVWKRGRGPREFWFCHNKISPLRLYSILMIPLRSLPPPAINNDRFDWFLKLKSLLDFFITRFL